MAKPKVEIDILQMELDQKLPHWLDPQQRDPAKYDAIREKHRAKWEAEQKKKRQQKYWAAAKAKAEATLDRTRDFDPNQPRDEHGRWTETGAGEEGGGAAPAGEPIAGFSAGIKADKDEAAVNGAKAKWFNDSPFKDDIEGAIAAAKPAQEQLGKVGEDIAKKHGIEFKNPGVKTDKARILEKEQLKGGAEKVTDLARGAFIISTPEQADAIAADLGRHFEVASESWKVTPVNYTDRALQVRFPNGLVGEVQLLDKGMFDAKMGKGHSLYVEQRKLDPVKDKARYDALTNEMSDLYGTVLNGYSPGWRAVLGIEGR